MNALLFILMLTAMAITWYGVFVRFVCEGFTVEHPAPAWWRTSAYAISAHLIFVVALQWEDSGIVAEYAFGIGAALIIIVSLIDYRRSFNLLAGGKNQTVEPGEPVD